MNHTTNYQLSQWEASDQLRRVDVNADNAKIDAALANLSTGRLRIEVGSYVGTGAYGQAHPCTITFSHKPMIIFLATNICTKVGLAQEHYILIRDAPDFPSKGGGDNDSNILTWAENSVSWYNNAKNYMAIRQFNENGKVYQYIALTIE